MRQPRDLETLAAACRVQDQVSLPGPVRRHVVQKAAHRVELLVARPDLPPILLAGPRVLLS